ncbi:MAG: class I SAM-dependent methyltransferase [Caldilineaceae bacterium]
MTATSYDAIAEWYAANVQEGGAGAWAFPSLLALLGEIRGQQICDLGCGEGRIARLLAQRGAQVVGVDRSAALINTAQRLEAAHPLGIHYQEDDAQSLTTIPDATFDGVVCGLALMDIPDLEATLRRLARAETERLVCLFDHPSLFCRPSCALVVTSRWRRSLGD